MKKLVAVNGNLCVSLRGRRFRRVSFRIHALWEREAFGWLVYPLAERSLWQATIKYITSSFCASHCLRFKSFALFLPDCTYVKECFSSIAKVKDGLLTSLTYKVLNRYKSILETVTGDNGIRGCGNIWVLRTDKRG